MGDNINSQWSVDVDEMEALQCSTLQHTERREVFDEEFLFYFILILIARSQDLLLLSVWNCTCSCRHFVDMLEP